MDKKEFPNCEVRSIYHNGILIGWTVGNPIMGYRIDVKVFPERVKLDSKNPGGVFKTPRSAEIALRARHLQIYEHLFSVYGVGSGVYESRFSTEEV